MQLSSFAIFVLVCIIKHLPSNTVEGNDVDILLQKVFYNKRLTGHVLETLEPYGLRFCVRQCLKMKDCFSINFDKKHFICELSSTFESNQTFLEKNDEYIYVGIKNSTSINSEVSGPTNECEKGAEYIDVKNGPVCMKTNCPSLSKDLLPGTKSSKIGTEVWNVYENSTTTCAPDGMWSNPKGVLFGCNQNWVRIKEHCYFVVEEWLVLNDAMNKCESIRPGSTMLSVVTEEESHLITNFIWVAGLKNMSFWTAGTRLSAGYNFSLSQMTYSSKQVFNGTTIDIPFAIQWAEGEPDPNTGSLAVSVNFAKQMVWHVSDPFSENIMSMCVIVAIGG